MLRNFIFLYFRYNFYGHERYLHRFDKSRVDCRPSNGRSVICAVKFWFWIRWSRGRERKKEKKGVLKYSYGLPCDVDRGSPSMDNTAVDSIFEFKEPARGLGWTCPHSLSPAPHGPLFYRWPHCRKVQRANVHAGFQSWSTMKSRN